MKRALRKSIKQSLETVSKESLHQQSTHIASVLRTLPEYQKSRKIAYYLHMDHQSEIETDGMIRNAFADNKRVFIPKMVPMVTKLFDKQTMELEMLEMESMESIDQLQPQGKYQIREPESGTDCFEAGGLDMIVLPGMGFTKQCARIGHGRGFYDSFIIKHDVYSANHHQPAPFLVAVGARQQLVESIPTEPHDRQLDAVIIDSDFYTK